MSRISFEALESRYLLDGLAADSLALLGQVFPNDYEQYMLEIVNRARANPTAEVARYDASYWDGTPDLNEGIAIDRILPTPKQPLAFNLNLIDAARQHSQWMIDVDVFSHTGAGGSNPQQRMEAAGYVFTPPWSWAENIGYKGTTGTPNVPAFIWAIEGGLFGDKGVPGRGHRINLMNPAFKEVGIGIVIGQFTSGGTTYNSVMVTEDFAFSTNAAFLTGVAYNDDAGDNDDFYSPGEGLGGVVITAIDQVTGAQYTTTTWASGGYTLPLAYGRYHVVAAGAGLGTGSASNIIVGPLNAKVDFTTDQSGPIQFVFNADYPARFLDEDGDLVTVSLTGPGSGTVSVVGTTSWRMTRIELNGTTIASTVAVGVAGGGGATSVDNIVVNSPLGGIIAPAVDLGENVAALGTLGRLELRHVAAGHTIAIGAAADPEAAVDLVFRSVRDAAIVSATPIGYLVAQEWLDTDAVQDVIAAPSIRRLEVSGDFEANLALTGVGSPAWALLAARVRGSVSADWNIAGAIGDLAIGEWDSGSLQATSVRALATGFDVGTSGNFAAGMRLTGAAAETLGTAIIAGRLDADWYISGGAGSIAVATWGAGSTLKLGLVSAPDPEFFAGEYSETVGSLGALRIGAVETVGPELFGVVARGFGSISVAGVRAAPDLPVSSGQFLAVAVCAQKAVSLPIWTETVDPVKLAASLDDLVALGANWVSVNVFWFQDNINSTVIAPDFTKWSARDDTVRAVIDALHARGMRVMLKPLVDLRNDPTRWRGEIVGSEQWFTGPQGYAAFINHWADIAQEKGVAALCVGTELIATAGEESRWRAVVAGVRSRFSGRLTYAANHGGTGSAVQDAVAWWDALDYIGIDAYYPLTASNAPTVAQLRSAWANRATMIQNWLIGLDTADQKPIIFTEIGYRSWNGTNIAPSSMSEKGGANIDQGEQADCYAAFFAEIWRRRGWLQGAFWWNWEIDPDSENALYPNWFPMQGKPARAVVQSYYGS